MFWSTGFGQGPVPAFGVNQFSSDNIDTQQSEQAHENINIKLSVQGQESQRKDCCSEFVAGTDYWRVDRVIIDKIPEVECVDKIYKLSLDFVFRAEICQKSWACWKEL